MTQPITSTLTWRPINESCNYMPESGSAVLVYDRALDDVVIASFAYNGEQAGQWIEETTDGPLPDPQFWTDMPFPGARP